ncbi:MAG: purine-nucleoside phosphorylase [Oscillospiraceae bacterium]|nr:purine-nucleoside phosphorylase [Oscillospiraceae bacterium]
MEYRILEEAVASVRKVTDFRPEVAVILGSGLGGYANKISSMIPIDYDEIAHFPTSTVPGHEGYLIFGQVGTIKVVLMQGRVHYYEGYTPDQVVMPIRVMNMLGAKKLIITNAAGGINWGFVPGDLMLIRDHICMVPSPLIGKNMDELGPRFPDMSDIYSAKLRDLVKLQARKKDIDLKEGVYIQVSGPQYETPSEIRMYRSWGADAVGMSTAVEAIAARHMGMRTIGLSLITNLACGMTTRELSHAEVEQTGRESAARFETLLTATIKAIGGSER